MHLSDEIPLTLEPRKIGARSDLRGPTTWRTLKLGVIPRFGTAIPAEAQLVLPVSEARGGEVCLVTVGPSRHLHPKEDLPFEIQWRTELPTAATVRYTTLLRATVRNVKAAEPWADFRFPLEPVAGTVGSIVVRNTQGWRFWRRPPGVVLYDLAISDEDTLDLERARSFRQLRIRNERANFDAYYQHAVFQPTKTKTGDGDPSSSTTTPTPQAVTPPAPVAASALEYARSRLNAKVGLTPPPFGERLMAKADAVQAKRDGGKGSKLRVLSLCSGAARIELDLVRHLSPELLSLTLLDVNPNLLTLAARTLSSWGPVQTIVADVNELDLEGEKFDVVICVSALHHVVELEHVIEQVTHAIGDTGEFWSIGETLGRNGGRMFPEAYAIADGYFSRLPEKYRFDRDTNSVANELPDLDYSIGCFEGIRAESIEPTLLRWLEPVQVSKHNCIVWKLFSLTYSDNFNMALDEDRKLVDAAVDLDVDLHRRGRFGVELHGIYRKKQLFSTSHDEPRHALQA